MHLMLYGTEIVIHLESIAVITAADYSTIYMLGRGGISGAIVIFILAKFLGR
jgi:hypothetical protein